MLKKTINVGGKEVAFRSSATVPRLYRAKFKRDIFKDLAKLQNSYKGTQEDGDEFAIDDLEIFENVAYIMAYHADNTISESIDEWLDQFEILMMPQNNMLQIRKRIMKSDILFSSFFLFL